MDIEHPEGIDPAQEDPILAPPSVAHDPNLSAFVLALQSESSMYACGICSKEFNHSYKLWKHKRMHNKHLKLKHACRVCGKRFPFPSRLRRHEEVHVAKPTEVGQGKTKTCEPRLRAEQDPKPVPSQPPTSPSLQHYEGNFEEDYCILPGDVCDDSSMHTEQLNPNSRRVDVEMVEDWEKEFMSVSTVAGKSFYLCNLCSDGFILKEKLKDHVVAIHNLMASSKFLGEAPQIHVADTSSMDVGVRVKSEVNPEEEEQEVPIGSCEKELLGGWPMGGMDERDPLASISTSTPEQGRVEVVDIDPTNEEFGSMVTGMPANVVLPNPSGILTVFPLFCVRPVSTMPIPVMLLPFPIAAQTGPGTLTESIRGMRVPIPRLPPRTQLPNAPLNRTKQHTKVRSRQDVEGGSAKAKKPESPEKQLLVPNAVPAPPESHVQTEVFDSFPCKLCPALFCSQWNLNAHRKMENAHPQVRIKLMKMARRTVEAGRIFTLKNITTNANAHTQQWYICVRCGRGSRSREIARIHQQVHAEPALTLTPVKRVYVKRNKTQSRPFQEPPILKFTNPSETEVVIKEELIEVEEILPTPRDSDMEVDPSTFYVESAMKFDMDLEDPEPTELTPQDAPLLLPPVIVAKGGQLSTVQSQPSTRYEQLKYACSSCGKRFDRPSSGKRHLEGEGSTIQRSMYCQRTFRSRGPRKCHEVGHRNKGICAPARILLDVSDRKDTDSDSLERNGTTPEMQMHEDANERRVEINSNSGELVDGSQKELMGAPMAQNSCHQCKVCGKGFLLKEKLQEHMISHIHQGSEEPRSAPRTSYQFDGIASYQETLGTWPSSSKIFSKTWAAIGDELKDFVKQITVRRKTLFVCKLCFKKFRFSNYVRQHVGKHIRNGELICESQKCGSGDHGNAVDAEDQSEANKEPVPPPTKKSRILSVHPSDHVAGPITNALMEVEVKAEVISEEGEQQVPIGSCEMGLDVGQMRKQEESDPLASNLVQCQEEVVEVDLTN